MTESVLSRDIPVENKPKTAENQTIDSKTGPTEQTPPQDNKEDVSFGLYEQVNNHPFFAHYYGMENLWNDPAGGFKEEVQLIENFFKNIIADNDLDNTLEAVRTRMKKIESECNVSKDESTNSKIMKTVAYIKYLQEVRDINKQKVRWSHGG